jgi:UDP-glucuronate 4-epimerase
LYRLPTTGLRFFTAYGPWGRPDMALFLFTRNILQGKPIQVFNRGNHTRDFTYIDDIVEGIVLATDDIPKPNPEWNSDQPDPATSNAPFRIFNIGNNSPVKLAEYIEALEAALGRKATQELLPLQDGDVPDSFADVSEMVRTLGFRPATPVKVGIENFVRWYRNRYENE